MSFFYILYILIKKILKILYWGRNLQGRTGTGPKPLAFELYIIIYMLIYPLQVAFGASTNEGRDCNGKELTWLSFPLHYNYPPVLGGPPRVGFKMITGPLYPSVS